MRIAVVGGDMRMLSVCKTLKERGYDCELCCFENLLGDASVSISAAVKNSDAVVLPLPFSKGGSLYAPFCDKTVSAKELLGLCGSRPVFAGGLNGQRAENAFDYSLCEALLIKNALITAEAALSIAMNEMKQTVFGSETVIVGYGRIGSFLAKMLGSLGAKVTVAARRSESRAIANASGHNSVDFNGLAYALENAQTVFNTVPSIAIGEKELSAINKNAFLLELASLPGGIDRTEAKNKGIKVIEALGLPGKYAPVSAGEAIAETVLPLLYERGITP